MAANGQQPTSFKTNVNRAKTKRWVEAKSYTYDGDDWGEADEYDEYGGYDDEPPTPPKPTGYRQQGQSAGYGTPTAPQQRRNENERPGYGNVPMQPQQQHGFRSTTNPQPRVTTDLERSNSFDRGDEKRAFSAGGYQYDMTSPSEAMSQQMYNTSNMQSPTQFNPNQMRQVQPDFREAQQQRQMPQQRAQSIPDPTDAYSPPANYGGPQSYDEPRQPIVGTRTQSMTSNTSSLDIHNRRDFTPSALPTPLHPQTSSPQGSQPIPQRPPRSSSLSQTTQPPMPDSAQGNTAEAVPEPNIPLRERTSSNADKPLPFVRPAEIYRRMQEEKDRERQSQDSSRPSIEATANRTNHPDYKAHPTLREEYNIPDPTTSATSIPVLKRTETDEYSRGPAQSAHSDIIGQGSSVTDKDVAGYQAIGSQHETGAADAPQSISNQGSLLPLLPEVARMSAFGESFLGTGTEGDERKPQNSASQRNRQPSVDPTTTAGVSSTDLQHQPSSGFRSVVNQAFDIPDDQIPPTPSTTAGSGIERSTSGGTSVISPIISRGPSTSKHDWDSIDAAKRPLTSPVAEELESTSPRPMSSESAGTSREGAQTPSRPEAASMDHHGPTPASFIPGHRRDLSTPSPGNSPARTPGLESNRQLRQPQEAELAVATPIESNFGYRMSPTTSRDQSNYARGESPSRTENHGQNNASNQSKVRDLAGKFESASSSRRGSDQSPTRRVGQLATTPQFKDPSAPSRPIGDRMESFRPRLPGAWESYVSNAPSSTSNKSQGDERGEFNSRLDEAQSVSQPSDGVFGNPRPDSPNTPKPATYADGKQNLENDPFSSVKAAGSALAGAFAAATGSDIFNSNESTVDNTHSAAGAPNEQTRQSRSRSISVNTTIRPEADRPPIPIVKDEADKSSIASTPSLNDAKFPSSADGPSDYFQPTAATDNQQKGMHSQQPKSVSRPPMPPSLSTDAGSHYESDRLRREIMRDLIPDVPSEPTTAESDSPYQDGPRLPASQTSQPRTGAHESMIIPREYDSYWNNAGSQSSSRSSSDQDKGVSSIGVRQTPPSAVEGEQNNQRMADNAQRDPIQEARETVGTRPPLEPHRFSWEQSFQSQQPTSESLPKPLPNSPPLQIPFVSEHGFTQDNDPERRVLLAHERDFADSPTVRDPFEKEHASTQDHEPKFDQTDSTHHGPPLPATSEDLDMSEFSSEKQTAQEPSRTQGQLVDPSHAEAITAGEPRGLHDQPVLANSPIPPDTDLDNNLPLHSSQQKIPAFREILAMKPASEAIRGFNEAREQYARSESGLSNWLAIKLSEFPEHADVLANAGRPPAAIMGHKASSSRLLSGLRSTSSQQQYNTNVRPGIAASDTVNSFSQASSPSGGGGKISSQQVQAKGKDLLHSAGVFGGKANVAAKGLFSKGRNRLKEARGSDKDNTPPSSPAPVPHGVQPQTQPPFEDSRNALSDLRFDSSAAASEQPNHTKSESHDVFGHDQQTTPHRPLNANTNLYNDSKTKDPEYSLQYSQDEEKEQPLRDANLHQLNRNDKNSKSYNPVPPDGFVKGKEIYPPSDGSTKEDLAVKDPLQSPEALSTGIEIWPDTEELAYKSRESISRGIAPDQRSVQGGLLNEAIGKHAETGQPQEKTLLIPRSHFAAPQEEPIDGAVGPGLQRPSSQQSIIKRVSEDSYNTFHTAADGDRSRPNSGSVTEILETPRAEKPQFLGPGEAALVNSEKGAPPSVLPPTSDFSIYHVRHGAQEQGNRLLPDRYATPSEIHPNPSPTRHADLAREPSLDNIDSQIESDRSPSPVSPQLSIHNESIRRQSTREPIYYGPQHDFGVKQTRNPARRQSRPSSQSGEDISLQGHPAFRTPTPSDQQHTSPVSDDAKGSGQLTSGFHPEENKSPTVRPMRTKSKSDRNSRNSGFFKSLGSSGKVGVPSIVSAAEIQPPPMSNMNATEGDKKSKRASLFRSRAGDKGDDDTRGIAGSSAPITTILQGSPATSKSSQLEEESSNDPNTSRTKLQRASTSGNKVAEGGGKKKRFSAIGSLFGRRSSRSQPSPASQPQPVPSYTSIPIQQPQPQTSYTMHRPLAEQSRSQQLSDHNRAPLGNSAPHQTDYSSPSRSDTFASQTSTPAWGQTAQRISQTRQSSLKEPSAYVQDSALRQQATSPPNINTSGPVRTSTSISQNNQSGTPASKPRTSFFSRSKSRESSIVGRNRESSANSWMTNKAQDRLNTQGNSFAGHSKPVSSTHSVQPSAQASSPEANQGSQRVLTFSQFGESHITTTKEQDQRDPQGQPVHQHSQQALNPQPPRSTSLGLNAPSTGTPRVLTFNQFGESYIAGSTSRSTAAPPTSEQGTASQPQKPNVVTFHQFPPEPNGPQSTRRASPPPPPPPPKDDWHVAKPRASSLQQPQANTVEQQKSTPSKTSTATPSSYPDPRRTSQTQHQAQREQRQAPPPLQTEIPSSRLSALSPEKTSAESRKARQRELEFVPSTEKEAASAPLKPDASSEENIVMSSSSYPGQEWQPSYAYDD